MKIFPCLIATLLLALSPIHSTAFAQEGDKTVVLFAATSTSQAVKAIKKAYEAKNPDIKIRVSYGASALLARQISKGAPADLYLSANKDWIDWLSRNKKNISEPINVAGNLLMVISPLNSGIQSCPATKEEFESNLKNKRFIIADPDLSPLGQYSKESLINRNQWQSVKDKLAIAGNAGLVIKMIERGAAPYGIAYVSGTINNKAIRELCYIDINSYSPINYYIISTKVASPAIASFRDYLAYKSDRLWINAGFRKFKSTHHDTSDDEVK